MEGWINVTCDEDACVNLGALMAPAVGATQEQCNKMDNKDSKDSKSEGKCEVYVKPQVSTPFYQERGPDTDFNSPFDEMPYPKAFYTSYDLFYLTSRLSPFIKNSFIFKAIQTKPESLE